MLKIWHDDAWEDYLHWQSTDKKLLERIHPLIKDCERNGYKGIGKPEPLRHDLAGWWSRRIDDDNRLVYRIRQGNLEILQCGSHYRDK